MGDYASIARERKRERTHGPRSVYSAAERPAILPEPNAPGKTALKAVQPESSVTPLRPIKCKHCSFELKPEHWAGNVNPMQTLTAHFKAFHPYIFEQMRVYLANLHEMPRVSSDVALSARFYATGV